MMTAKTVTAKARGNLGEDSKMSQPMISVNSGVDLDRMASQDIGKETPAIAESEQPRNNSAYLVDESRMNTSKPTDQNESGTHGLKTADAQKRPRNEDSPDVKGDHNLLNLEENDYGSKVPESLHEKQSTQRRQKSNR